MFTHHLQPLLVACLAALALSGSAYAATTGSGLQIASPGTAKAHVVPCTGTTEPKCDGTIEFNGTIYPFAAGTLTGRVSATGAFSGRGIFGAARTDPATEGPLQFTVQPVLSGGVGGGFTKSQSPGPRVCSSRAEAQK